MFAVKQQVSYGEMHDSCGRDQSLNYSLNALPKRIHGRIHFFQEKFYKSTGMIQNEKGTITWSVINEWVIDMCELLLLNQHFLANTIISG